MPRGVKSDLRQLVERNPQHAKEVIEGRLKRGATLKSLASLFNIPYNTLYRMLQELGIDTKTSRSSLSTVTGKDWHEMDLFSIGVKYGFTYTNVYNYKQYHREKVNGKVAEYLAAIGGTNPTKDPQAPLASGSGGSRRGIEQLPGGGEGLLPSRGSDVVRDKDGEDDL